MRDQRVVSLAERIFADAVEGLCHSMPIECEREAETAIEVAARKSVVAAEKFYEVLQEGESPSSKGPQPGKKWNYPGHEEGCNCFYCSR